MAAYPPVDPTDPTEPTDARGAKHGAAELRALKGRVNDIEGSIGISAGVCGGRLTLTEADPVQISSVAAADRLYFVPAVSNIIALYDGTNFVPRNFDNLMNVTTNAVENPAPCAANSLYDLFVWQDGTPLRLVRGPAWPSPTSRGTGAGTTQLIRINGVYLNAVDITNGPPAQRGTYVGTMETDAAGLLNFSFGGNSPGGVEIQFLLWNFYNQVLFSCDSKDVSVWLYDIPTIRPLNNSILNRIRFVRGARGHHMFATLSAFAVATPAADPTGATIGFGLDSITAFNGNSNNAAFVFHGGGAGVSALQMIASYSASPGIGVHYLQALEYAKAGPPGGVTFSGNGTTMPGASIGITAQWAG